MPSPFCAIRWRQFHDQAQGSRPAVVCARWQGGTAVKITDVRTAEVQGHGYSTYVRVYTDEGLEGNGECIHGGEGCPALIHALKPTILGENPLQVERLFEKMRR